MFRTIALVVLAAAGLSGQAPADLSATIDRLGSFDDAARIAAAHDMRRVGDATAVPALAAAARSHRDEYVRFRALVLLSDYGETAAAPVMRDLMVDRDDRLRTVAYEWFEHHSSPDVLPRLLGALDTEHSEFVRPALTRAIAARGDDPRARAALVPLVTHGEDLFRGSVIAALGDYHGRYALDDIIAVAKLEGPLQDDAITAMGNIGGPPVPPALAALEKTAPREEQPTIAAASCLAGGDCNAEMAYLKQTLTFAATTDGYQPLLRGATHALGVLAVHGGPVGRDALDALIDAGVPARDEARGPIALAVGLVALRTPDAVLAAVAARKGDVKVLELVRDAFDLLSSEDFSEEAFYVTVRAAYWGAPAGSPTRTAAGALIDALEF